MILYILVVAVLFYSIVQIGLWIGLLRCRYSKQNEQPIVSIIVAARNEEAHISQLLNCLFSQTYPQYEIIIANDRSTDRTGEILEQYAHTNPSLKVITITSVPSDMPPKKNALTQAIREAQGEILCFTDADCLPPPEWVQELVAAFDPTVGFVAGYSPYLYSHDQKKLKLLHYFIAYEEFRAALFSAGSIGWKKGWLCTGRNLAYRKIVFEEVGGYEKIKHSISGDDDLFLQFVRKTTNWHMRYVFSKNNHVPTYPPPSFWEFVEQRKRHFSAAKYFPISMKLFFAMYHGSNLFIVLCFIASFWIPDAIALSFLSLWIKFCSDYVLIRNGAIVLEERQFVPWFIPMELLYLLYNVCIGPLGLLFKFSWKPEK